MEQLVNFIIRPPRAEYNPEHDLLDEEFMLKGKWYRRKDLEVKNSRGDVLKCSHYVPIVTPDGKPLPCVIYCHGNSGCRADASEAAIILLPSNITVFSLDFSGSGLSGGEHVTLGWNEKDDLKAVVDYLRADGNVSLIGLWGRSMGAVTSLMYGAEDPSIAGMVLDSPFSDLVDLMMELVDTYKIRLPKFTVKFAIQYMKKAIQKKAKFDITDLNTIKVAQSCFVPALFGHAVDDDFIQPHHSDRIFEVYAGDKNIIKFEGDHNSPRPQFYFDSINIFFHNVLQPPEDEVKASYFDAMPDYFPKDSWSTLHEASFHPGPSTTSKEALAGNTTDAINQVRSKRPMSRTEVPSDISAQDNPAETRENENTSGSSPSSMISFEFSNGQPYGPHVPTITDDDQYVEYQLDDFTGFPSNAEEEERMLMEAVMMSLRDLERGPSEEAKHSLVTTDLAEPLGKDDRDNPSPTVNHKPLTTETAITSTSAENHEPSNATSSASPAMDTPSNQESTSKGTSSKQESTSKGTSSRTHTLEGVQSSSSDTDMSSNTKATVTVVKNPPGHIMEGLMRRWDFSFFRNNR